MGWSGAYENEVKEFTEHLIGLRKSQGMTQHDLAIASGLTRRVIGSYERGKSQPSLTSLFALAKGLEVDIHQLFPVEGKTWVNRKKFVKMSNIVSKITNNAPELADLNEAVRGSMRDVDAGREKP